MARLPKALARRITVSALPQTRAWSPVSGSARSPEWSGPNWASRRRCGLPPARTKNGTRHSVPLSGMARALIDAALADIAADCPFVFPAESGGTKNMVVAKTLQRALGRLQLAPFTSHDLRRTMLTELGRLGVAPIVRGHIANHRSVTRAGVTLGVYDQHSYAAEKAQAMELWGERLAAIIAGESNNHSRAARAPTTRSAGERGRAMRHALVTTAIPRQSTVNPPQLQHARLETRSNAGVARGAPAREPGGAGRAVAELAALDGANWLSLRKLFPLQKHRPGQIKVKARFCQVDGEWQIGNFKKKAAPEGSPQERLKVEYRGIEP